MKKLIMLVLSVALLCMSGEALAKKHVACDSIKPVMVNKPIEWNDTRLTLMREYAKIHYGMNIDSIVPQMIILHWTASNSLTGTYNYFYPAAGKYNTANGRLNVASHYLVDRDGTIYQLTPETALNRHAIGYNWCAIGVENVGGVNSKADLTKAQVQANIALIRYLSDKYASIKYVIGHYQVDKARSTGLYIEKIPGYHSDKIDPGPYFMSQVHQAFKDSKLKFLAE